MLEYSVALLNVWWSKGEINNRFFDSVEEQSTYFDKMVGGQTSPLTNFNMGNNVETAITFLDKTNKSIEELVSSNYCVIYKKENGIIIDRRYFFAYPSQDSGRQMRVLLSLDDIQTNYVKYKKSISPCNIKRACLNRFIKNGENNYTFDDSIYKDNHIFEEEAIGNFPKRITQRYSITPTPDLNLNSPLSKWIKENILGWQYIYIDSSKDYQIFNTTTKFSLTYGNIEGGSIRGATGIIALPIYKSDKKIIVRRSEVIEDITYYYDAIIDDLALQKFKNANNDESYFYANKFSILPPFRNGNFNNYSIENGNLVFNQNWETSVRAGIDNAIIVYTSEDLSSSQRTALFSLNIQYLNDEIVNYLTLPFRFNFQKGDIINSLKNYELNPKMLSSKYIEVRITNGNGEKFSYNLQKIGTNKLKLKYKEALTPDITRSMFFIENGQYTKENAQGYLGLINSFDNSLMQSNEQLQQFLAQNKNFHLQKGLSWGVTGGKELLKSLTAQGPSIQPFIDILSDGINTHLTLDNLENAPDILKNANGNAIFNLMASGQNLIVEIYDSLPSEKEEANDYMVQFGFYYNHIDKLENVDNIRKRFNYIEADVETINAPISNIEKERLRDLLKSIRFWNSDKVDYTLENYERWLENE